MTALAAAGGVSAAAALSATAAPAPPPAPDTLNANGSLTSGQFIASPDGHFRVTMDGNGNLVESISGGRGLWSTGTAGHPGARALMQVNGNLAIYDTANAAVWSSNSPAASGCPRLVLQDDGNLVIYTDKAIWAAGSRVNRLNGGDVLRPGWSIYSIGPEDYRLTMGTGGRLVLYDAAGRDLWNTPTFHHPGAYAAMQTDGNLVVYSPSGYALWSTATNGHPGARLEMLGDGNVDVIDGSTVLWRSKTYHAGSGGSLAPRAPAPVTCPAPVSPAPTTTTTTTVTVPTVVTVPVTTPVPRPAPRPRALRIKLQISWTWNRATTRLRRTKVGTLPYRTHLEVQCRGRGCPRGNRKLRATGIGGVRRLLHRLRGWRYRAGDRILITLTAPRYRAERAEVDIRWGRKPGVRLLRR
ncbi:MAG TPA: hypothetical protein VFN87_16520 [Solirubrobacteraceae bacterium]|nr:hypothetical protein [Solirubrobacteraceae bacterium]